MAGEHHVTLEGKHLSQVRIAAIKTDYQMLTGGLNAKFLISILNLN
jgi:hypothetical protein